MNVKRYHESSIKCCYRLTRVKGFSGVYKLTPTSPLQKQVVSNVSANKQQIIELIMDQLSSLPIPEGKQIILTGQDPCPIEAAGVRTQQPTNTYEEADVLVAHCTINEATRGHSLIKVVSDDTDVLVLLAPQSHH